MRHEISDSVATELLIICGGILFDMVGVVCRVRPGANFATS